MVPFNEQVWLILNRPLSPIALWAKLQSIGFVVIDELFGRRVDTQGAIQYPGQGSCMAGNMRVAHDGGVADRLLPALDTIKKVSGVGSNVQSTYPLNLR